MQNIYRAEGISIDRRKLKGNRIKAAYYSDDNDCSVLVNKSLPKEPKLFALAHELKHHYMDRQQITDGVIECGDYNAHEIIEKGAEVFAAEFIYPEVEMRRLIGELGITNLTVHPKKWSSLSENVAHALVTHSSLSDSRASVFANEEPSTTSSSPNLRKRCLVLQFINRNGSSSIVTGRSCPRRSPSVVGSLIKVHLTETGVVFKRRFWGDQVRQTNKGFMTVPENNNQPLRTPPTSGVFISKGMRVGMPRGGLTIKDGQLRPVVLHAVLDVVPHWLAIALKHLQVAGAEHVRLSPAWQEQANDEIARVLEAEFVASMQAVMAAAISMDAFYARVKEYVIIPSPTLDAWRQKGTARYKQVYETIRRGFKVRKEALPKLREALKEIYRFRDLAVHPDQQLAEPLRHPDLGVGTEWRFVYYRFENAKGLVNVSLSLIIQLLNSPKPNNPDLQRYALESLPLLQPLVDEWEDKYGELYPRPMSKLPND